MNGPSGHFSLRGLEDASSIPTIWITVCYKADPVACYMWLHPYSFAEDLEKAVFEWGHSSRLQCSSYSEGYFNEMRGVIVWPNPGWYGVEAVSSKRRVNVLPKPDS